MRDIGFSKADYCRDIFLDEGEDFLNAGLRDRLLDIVTSFCPAIVVTTSKNRYLEAICADRGIPLICAEMGPMPRLGFPNCRHISVGQHISRSLPLDVIEPPDCHDDEGQALSMILERQANAVAASPMAPEIASLMSGWRELGSIAILALQPSDWVTWEGSLGRAATPAEIVLLALDRMSADYLVVLFHPELRGVIDAGVMAEIWLSDPRVLRAPAELAVGLTEKFLPFADELITVSSNLGFLAFIYGKRVQTLGTSFLDDLKQAPGQGPANKSDRQRIAAAVLHKLHVDGEVFADRARLRDLIEKRLWAGNHGDVLTKPARRSPALADWVVDRTLDDDLDRVHGLIRENLETVSEDTLFQNFGRNFLGYTVPKNAIGAELGVAGGYFSDSLLMSGRFRKLFSIDAWSDHHSEEEYRAVKERLGRFGPASQVLRHTFDDALGKIPDGSLDFLYVDGYAHTGMNADLIRKWTRKLAPGAVVAGHDYCAQIWPINHTEIKRALDSPSYGLIRTIEGVLTRNPEDAIPSFAATYRPTHGQGFFGRLSRQIRRRRFA